MDSQNALAAGDYTALIQGCGLQLNDGFIVCRKQEGDATQDLLHFVAPPVECANKDSCVSFKILFPDGSNSFGAKIPKGSVDFPVPWTELTHKKTFDKGDRGFWGYSYDIQYTGSDGQEYHVFTLGEIYMRVIAKGYDSLHASVSDPNFAMEFVYDGIPVKMTTGGRTYVGKKSP